MKPPFALQSSAFLFCVCLSLAGPAAQGQTTAAGIAPRTLIDPAVPGADKQITTDHPEVVSTQLDKDGITVTVQPGKTGYPGINIKPAEGAAWDLAAWGHIEAHITNLGEELLTIGLRADNAGPWQESPWNSLNVRLKPGDSKTVSLIFGYDGTEAGYKLKPEAVIQLVMFTTKSEEKVRKFRIDSIQAAGATGEKPAIDPNSVKIRPANGVLLGAAVTVDAAKQIAAKGGAKAALGKDGKSMQIDFKGAPNEAVTLKPSGGAWNLNQYFEVRVKLKNVGTSPVAPGVRVESRGGMTDVATARMPLAPNAESEIVASFAASVPWKAAVDPQQQVLELKKNWESQPNTGTKFVSHSVTGVTISSDGKPESLLVTSIAADVPLVTLPAWVGQKPPVEGAWTKTFDDSFSGTAIDLTKWNVYIHGGNPWDTRTHFEKSNVIEKDGNLILRAEKKTGHQNDDPAGKETAYATGYADTVGKWTQKYGYFEARVKLPTAPCVWPAFWLMPDRGAALKDINARQNTKEGGMEFDILEFLSIWGVNRYNIAMHWDGYQKYHKSLGSTCNYVPADKDGYVVSGMLWTPGSAIFYGNGKELGRWESPRICSVQSAILLTHVMGGWEKESIDESQLPSDFTLDYVRVWQRKDLATAEDGPKPNSGGLGGTADDK